MSSREQHTMARGHRRLTRIVVASAAAVLLVAPGIAGAGDDVEQSDDEKIAEGVAVQQKFVAAYNAKAWDKVGALYAEDAIAIPPNHEPIRGRAAIVEYWKSVRDSVGEGKCAEAMDGVAGGKYVANVSRSCTAYSGGLGFTTHELVERGEDGIWRYKFDMFGLR